MQKPKKVDLELWKLPGRYLADRTNFGTFVGLAERKGSLEVCTDSDWQGCPGTRRACQQRGGGFSRRGRLRKWECQHCSAEAELMAAIAGEVEMHCAAHLLQELGETVKEKLLWTDSWARKSVLTRIGPG